MPTLSQHRDEPSRATSTINFRAGQVKANNAIVPLATDGSGLLALRATCAGAGPVQVIVDVNGYFE